MGSSPITGSLLPRSAGARLSALTAAAAAVIARRPSARAARNLPGDLAAGAQTASWSTCCRGRPRHETCLADSPPRVYCRGRRDSWRAPKVRRRASSAWLAAGAGGRPVAVLLQLMASATG